jgi:hypothetical protein
MQSDALAELLLRPAALEAEGPDPPPELDGVFGLLRLLHDRPSPAA